MNVKEYRDLVHKHTENFDVDDAIKVIKGWLIEYSLANNMKKAVLGISGGKDSTVVAKLLVDTLGKENVFGLLMPNGEQKDISDSIRVVELLDIGYETININDAYNAIVDMISFVSSAAKINIAPRIRMTTLYTWGQTYGYRVAGTGNLSERMVGYTTKFGDNASDFNLIGNFTSLEVMRIGEELGLPLELVYKAPADGLTGLTDEEILGVTYIEIHNFIRNHFDKIDFHAGDIISAKIRAAEHKRSLVPMVPYEAHDEYAKYKHECECGGDCDCNGECKCEHE